MLAKREYCYCGTVTYVPELYAVPRQSLCLPLRQASHPQLMLALPNNQEAGTPKHPPNIQDPAITSITQYTN